MRVTLAHVTDAGVAALHAMLEQQRHGVARRAMAALARLAGARGCSRIE